MELAYRPALDHLDLLGAPVAKALADWPYADRVLVAEIDPELADTAAMSEAYGFSMLDSANCVVVSGKRAGEERVAACMVRADTRADVNNVVKRTLDVRKASFHPMERAVEESGMEYGGIKLGLHLDGGPGQITLRMSLPGAKSAIHSQASAATWPRSRRRLTDLAPR